jgi:hypothetical protein
MLATVINYDAAQVAGVASALDAHVEAQAVGLEDLFIDLVGYAQRSTTVAA